MMMRRKGMRVPGILRSSQIGHGFGCMFCFVCVFYVSSTPGESVDPCDGFSELWFKFLPHLANSVNQGYWMLVVICALVASCRSFFEFGAISGVVCYC